jgi:hypothetical protein
MLNETIDFCFIFTLLYLYGSGRNKVIPLVEIITNENKSYFDACIPMQQRVYTAFRTNGIIFVEATRSQRKYDDIVSDH